MGSAPNLLECPVSIDFESFTPERLQGTSEKWSRRDAIGAGVAEMDFGIAPAIRAVLREAVEDGAFGYPTDGQVEAVRTSCAGWYERECGWQVVFPALHRSLDPRDDAERRHHVDDGMLARAL